MSPSPPCHTHHHGGHRPHGKRRGEVSARLTWVLAITAVFMLAEVAGGLLSNSLALLADAGHMLTDVIGLGMALDESKIEDPRELHWSDR